MGDVKKKEGETPKEPQWGENRRNPVVIHQALGAECKEPNGDISNKCAEKMSKM